MISENRKKRNKESLGVLLKDARVKQGYTQRALADALGLTYYTMISQMELGYIAIPANLWVPLARKLRMDESDWVLKCVSQHHPEIVGALFDYRSNQEIVLFLDALRKGQLEEFLTL